MPHIVIKAEPNRDAYVYWSTIVEAPLTYGTRAEMLECLAKEWRKQHPGMPTDSITDPAARLDRADRTGTSAAGGFAFFGAWDYEEFIYEQRGYLARRDLLRAVQLLCEDREAEVWDLLTPLEERAEVRRG